MLLNRASKEKLLSPLELAFRIARIFNFSQPEIFYGDGALRSPIVLLYFL